MIKIHMKKEVNLKIFMYSTNSPELQLLSNYLNTRSDEELLSEVVKLRKQRKQISEIQTKLNLTWFLVATILTSYGIEKIGK